MNIPIDEVKLTAYGLGELTEAARAEVAREIASSTDAQNYLAELGELAGALREEFADDLRDAAALPGNVIPLPTRDDPWTPGWRLAIAAVLAVTTVIAALALSSSGRLRGQRTAVTRVSQPSPAETTFYADVDAQSAAAPPALPLSTPFTLADSAPAAAAAIAPEFLKEARSNRDAAAPPSRARVLEKAKSFDDSTESRGQVARAFALNGAVRDAKPEARSGAAVTKDYAFNTAAYDHIAENPFLAAKENPLSTFSIDVDTASYANVRRFINQGSLPPKDAVRIEELINYFTYDYPQPLGEAPFSVNVDGASCPWNPEHRLVRIGLKGREIANDKRGASNLVFLLDVSGSMMPAERLPLIKQSMRLLVEKLTENDRVAIVVYAGASGLALPSTPGNEKEKILAALEELKAGGSTNGAEGIGLAYKVAAENFIKGGVNRVILATDGDFNVGTTSQGELVRLIEEKAKTGVFLSVLGVGTDNLKDSTMQKLADTGNGNYAYLDSLDEARKVLVQQMNGTLVTIAKDVKIQVEFNPGRVASYRLIGYEKRLLRKEDFNDDKIDAGEIGAGHTVTALYEVVPVGVSVNPAASVPPVDVLKYSSPNDKSWEANASSSSTEMLTVKLRYKKPDGDKSELTERTFTDAGLRFENAPADLKFAAAVAEFGMLLRDSEHKGNGSLGAVLEWATEGKDADANGYRAGFMEIVRKAQALQARGS